MAMGKENSNGLDYSRYLAAQYPAVPGTTPAEVIPSIPLLLRIKKQRK